MTRFLRRLIPAGLIVAAVVLAYQLAFWSSRGGEGSPLYSARRHDPYGTAALFDLLRERGVPVQLHERSRLEPQTGALLVQVVPHAEEETERATEELVDWAAEGNTVVQLTRQQTKLMNRLGIRWRPKDVDVSVKKLEAAERAGKRPEDLPGDDAEATWVLPRSLSVFSIRERPPRLLLHAPRTLDDSTERQWESLAIVQGQPVAAVQRLGQGQVIVIGAPTPALNGWLADEGNAWFFVRLAGEGPVYLDESILGLGRNTTMVGLILQFGLGPLLVQTIFLLGLYVWTTRGRTVVDSAPVPRRRSGAEQIETLGYLYGKVLEPLDVCRMAGAELKRRLMQALRTTPGRWEQRLRQLKPERTEPIMTMLQDAEQLEANAGWMRRRVLETELEDLLQRAQALGKELAR